MKKLVRIGFWTIIIVALFVSVIQAKPEDPNNGKSANEKIKLLSVSDSPDPFSAQVTEATFIGNFELRRTDVLGSQGKEGRFRFFIKHTWVIVNAQTNQEVNSLVAEQDVTTPPDGGNTFTVSVTQSWNGQDSQGQLVADGSCNYTLTGRLFREKLPELDDDDAKRSGVPTNVGDKDKLKLVGVSNSLSGTILTDNTPPAIADLIPVPGSILANAQPTISANYTDLLSGIDPTTAVLILDGTDVTSQATVTEEGITYVPSENLPDLNHIVTLCVKDKAGNLAEVTWQFITDITLPGISDLTPPDGTLIDDVRPTISANYSDQTSGINVTTAKIILDDNDVTAQATVTEEGISYKPSENLLGGVHAVKVEVKDRAGNLAEASWSFTVDITPPEITDLNPSDNAIINNARPIISANYSDEGSGIDVSTAKMILDGNDVTAQATVTEQGISYIPSLTPSPVARNIVCYYKGVGPAYYAIAYYDLSTNTSTDLPLPTERRVYITVGGMWGNIISYSYRDADGDHFVYYDISTERLTNIPLPPDKRSPCPVGIHRNIIAYYYRNAEGTYVTAYYDISTGTSTDISLPPGMDSQPAVPTGIHNNIIVYGYGGASGRDHLAYYDILTDTSTIIPLPAGAQYVYSKGVYENIIIYRYYSDGDYLIVYYDISTGTSTNIPLPSGAMYPETRGIYKNIIIYRYYSDGNYLIAYYDLSTNTSTTIPLPSNTRSAMIQGIYENTILYYYETVGYLKTVAYYDISTGTSTVISPDVIGVYPYPVSISGMDIFLEDGTHTVKVEVKDRATNLGEATWSFMTDITPPEISDLTPPNGAILNNSKPTISANYSDQTSGIDVSTAKMVLDGNDVTAQATEEGISYTSPENLLDGTHTVKVEVKDQAGNLAEVTWGFITDTTSPVISSSPAHDEVVTTPTPELVVNYSDLTSGIDLSTLKILFDNIDKTNFFTITPSQATYQIPEEEALRDGFHTLEASIDDRVGNSVSYTATFLVPTAVEVIQPEEGGTVEVTDPASPIFGVVIDIPPDALTEVAIISIWESDPALLPALPEGVAPAGLAVDFNPSGLVFTQPVTIKVPYSEDILLATGRDEPEVRLCKFDFETNQWIFVPIVSVDVDNNLIVAGITILAPFQPVYLVSTELIKVSGDNQVGTVISWLQVSAGKRHTLALKTDGTLWAWGGNDEGQLGLGSSDSNPHPDPVQVGTDTNWAQAAAGSHHTLSLKTDGTLWVWGSGYGTTPAQIGIDTDWWKAAACGFHNLAIKTNGTLWAWGSGYGTTPAQIGIDTDWFLVAAGHGHTLAIKNDGTLWAWGYGYGTTPTQVGTDTDWVVVAVSGNTNLAIKTDGTLWTWGTTPTQVGTDTDWSAIACGYGSHILAIKTDGTLWAWGGNYYGQLGLGDTIPRYTPTQVGTDTNWADVVVGYAYTVALKTNGALWAWGYNSYGRLGVGDTTNRNIPTQVELIKTILPEPFVTLVLDCYGNPIPGQEVTFTVTQGTGRFLDPPTVLKDLLNSWTNTDVAFGSSGAEWSPEEHRDGESQANSVPPPDIPEPKPDGYDLPFDATGTEFVLKDNPCFPNLKITSSEAVRLVLEAITGTVSFLIEPLTTTTQTKTTMTISGLEPFWNNNAEPIPLFRHQEGYVQAEFTVDEQGEYSYVQDISKVHHVYFLTYGSTIYITEDTVLTTTVNEPIVIAADNITLDGQNNLISGPGSGYGIYLFERTGVTIKDCVITDFDYGIYFTNSNYSIFTNNTASNNSKVGIYLSSSSNNILTDNTANNNTLLNGIYLYSSSNSTLINNTANNNNKYGICLSSSPNNTLIDNTANNNPSGICLISSSNSTLINNTANNNSNYGIYLRSSSNNTAINNNVKNNGQYGIYLYLNSNNNTFANNTVSSNDYGLYLSYSADNIFYYNNIYDNTTYNVWSDQAIYLDNGSEGNWWGHTEAPGFYVYGGPDTPYDSNRADVIDRYPYLKKNGWLPFNTCTVSTDENGYATAWPFQLGDIGEVNLITAAVSGTSLSVVFKAASTTKAMPAPDLDPDCPTMTTHTTPEFFGQVSPEYAGYTINIYYNGELIATTIVQPDGSWSVESTLAFTVDGTYSFDIQLVQPDIGVYSYYYTAGITIDTTPPAAPAGLTAEAGDGYVDLTWNPNTEPDLGGYRIYRQGPGEDEFVLISGAGRLVDPATTKYRDTAVVDKQTYYYKITALDIAVNESE